MTIFALRKQVLLEAQTTPVQREQERRLASLGPGGCSACMSNPCQYNPILDPEVSLQLFHVFVIVLIPTKKTLGPIGRVQEQHPTLKVSQYAASVNNDTKTPFRLRSTV